MSTTDAADLSDCSNPQVIRVRLSNYRRFQTERKSATFDMAIDATASEIREIEQSASACGKLALAWAFRDDQICDMPPSTKSSIPVT